MKRILVIFIGIFTIFAITTGESFAITSSVNISLDLAPADATSFSSTPGYLPGEGKCELTWITSTTPNVIEQRIYVDSGSGIDIYTEDFQLPLGPGDNAPDSLEISGLIVGWTYIIQHISSGGPGLDSAGVWTTCTPAAALPAPVLNAEPATTTGTSNTLTWTNGGVNDPALDCKISVSLNDLDNNPTAATVAESPWVDCPSSATTYSHTFNGLIVNNTYYYHVWSTDDGGTTVSPYSNVELSTQIEGGGGGDEPPPAGGGHPAAPVCGNGIKEKGEECDDGDTFSGDGCDFLCRLEEEEECGNGILEGTEQCDDGNLIDGDGCNSACEEEELVEVIFEIKGKPQYRAIIDSTPNLRLNANLHFFKQSTGSVDTDGVTLDAYGLGTYEAEIMTGTYDIGLNGDAHNTKIIRNVEITPTTETVTLDFTFSDTVELVAGDTHDDNYVNAIDIAKLLGDYKATGQNVNDLNKESVVNAIDVAIMVWNYKEEGEYFFQSVN